MSAAGKKGKKTKCKTVDLMSFLADGDGAPTVPLKTSSWADDIEDDHDGYSSRASRKPVVLPTAPRATRHIDDSDVPSKPPYVAYLTNLPYEVDEEDLVKFFADLKIASMRLPKDTNILKGSGYVEFEDRESLIDALCKSNTQMKTRRVRIEVSNSTNDDRRGGRMGRNNRRDGFGDPERTSGDWRSGPRDETAGSDGDSHRGGSRFENRDRREEREPSEYDNKPGGWRDSGDRGRPSLRDGGDRGFRRDDRERDGGGREWSRYGGDRGSRDRDGGDRDRGTSFGPRRTFGDSDREWERDGLRQDRDRMDKPSEARTRPKLQLQPRTKPVEPIAVQDESDEAAADEPVAAPAPAPTSAPVPAANIFGAAKPVDTTAREREIEERLAKTYADARPKEDGEDKRKEGTWGRRNGEGRDERDKERSRPTWRSDEDRGRRPRSSPRDQDALSDHSETGGQPPSRGPPSAASRPPPRTIETRAAAPERERKDRDDITRMPKAKDEEPPNFVASNKYSMLPDEEEEEEVEDDENPDNIDD